MGDKKIKVLHLIDSGGLYGAEKMLLSLISEQLSQQLDPMILSVREPKSEVKPIEVEAERLGLPLTKWEMKPGFNLIEAWKILRWAKSHGYSMLHSHGYKFNLLLGFIPKFIRGIPFVSTVHGYTATPSFTKVGIYTLLDRASLRFHDFVVFVSAVMGKGESRQAVRRSMVIPNGIPDNDDEGSENVEEWDFQEYIPFLLFVGRLSNEKGVDILIQAFSKVRERTNIQLIVVGEGPELDRLARLAKQHRVLEYVHFVGYQAEVANFMRYAQALVLPSRMEGLPITLLEGMKYRTPIVATRVGGIGNVLGNGELGTLVNPEDSVDLADGILKVICDEEYRRKVVVRAHEEYMNNYTSRKMADRYMRVYQGL